MIVIPFNALDRQYKSIREEIQDISDQVYASGKVLDGNFTREFETQIARRCNREYAVAVNSGTQALIFAQQATAAFSNLLPSEYSILIPTISYVATVNSVVMNRYNPVFCDVDFKGLIDLNAFDEKLDQSVNAIMYVNLFGNCVDWDRFQMQTKFFNDNLVIIEDAAQSFGASYQGVPSGKMGDVSVLSFDPTKNLPNYGSGGMILTDDHRIYESCRMLRDNGKPVHDTPGTNSKMSEVDCAQMLVKLNYFDEWQRRRKEIANYYTEELYQYVDILVPNKGVEHAWHKFVIRTENRSALMSHLSYNGIETKIHYDYALFDYGVGFTYANWNNSNLFSETASFTRECLSLPIYPELTDAEVETVVEKIKQYIEQ